MPALKLWGLSWARSGAGLEPTHCPSTPVSPAYICSNQIMGWGEKAIEIRSVETGHLDGVFMHKRAQRLKFLCERNDKVRAPCPLEGPRLLHWAGFHNPRSPPRRGQLWSLSVALREHNMQSQPALPSPSVSENSPQSFTLEVC